LAARAAWRPRRWWRRWRSWERGLAERHRVLLRTVALPAAVWLALPPHLKSFFGFVENRSSGPPLLSAAGLLHYPRVFVEQYHAAPWLGVAMLVLALAALARIGRASPGARVALLALALGLASVTLHPYKEPRFFFVMAPLVWLAGAWNAVTLAEGAAARGWPGRGAGAAARLSIGAAIALAAVVAIARVPALAPGMDEAIRLHTVPASAAPVIDRVVKLAAERPTLVLGTWNQASPALIEWRSRQLHPAAHALPELVVSSRRGGSAETVLRRLRTAQAPAQLVLVELASGDGRSLEWETAFATETAWLEPVRRDLAAGVLPYVPSGDERFPGTGYRLRIYRLERAPPPSSGGAVP
ncbi:MAG TPA: hypothetical protein VMS86_13135, partial [Thermoanaerobaculia bacterium]|nr:hypothetical protein [Thermoanaerobaculia bacterium]